MTFSETLSKHYAQWLPKDAPPELYREHLSKLLEAHAEHLKQPPKPRMPTLRRPLLCWDTETTGTSPVEDRVIEFGCVVLQPDGTRSRWQQRFRPDIPIPAEATAIHGISDADVADCPKFADLAHKIHKGFAGKDIAGYSVRLLDLPILDEEFRRVGLKLDLTGVNVIDVAGVYFKKEPRDLSAAVKKYTGRDHADAHGAAADAEGTLDSLLGQLGEYEDLAAMDLIDLAKFSLRGDDGKLPADIAGKLYMDSDGDLRYTLTKVRDIKVKCDPGFAYWMLKQCNPPFPASTVECLRAELERCGL